MELYTVTTFFTRTVPYIVFQYSCPYGIQHSKIKHLVFAMCIVYITGCYPELGVRQFAKSEKCDNVTTHQGFCETLKHKKWKSLHPTVYSVLFSNTPGIEHSRSDIWYLQFALRTLLVIQSWVCDNLLMLTNVTMWQCDNVTIC